MTANALMKPLPGVALDPSNKIKHGGVVHVLLRSSARKVERLLKSLLTVNMTERVV